jgi:hypothetical protein
MDEPDEIVLFLIGWVLGEQERAVQRDEVKPAYISRIGILVLREVYMLTNVDNSGNTDIYVCFSPQSAAFTERAKQKCEETLPEIIHQRHVAIRLIQKEPKSLW